MIDCNEKYLEKQKLVNELMRTKQKISNHIDIHAQRLKVIEENILALNMQIQVLEKELTLANYDN